MRLAIVTTYPPGTGSLNEYAFHFVKALRQKSEVKEILLLVDHLPEGQKYDPNPEPDHVPLRFIPCWRFGSLTNATSILATLKAEKPDAVLFNIQFATFGRSKITGALGLTAPALAKAAGFPTIVLLHNIMETVDLKQAGFAVNPVMEWAIRRAGRLFTQLLLRADLVALTIPKYVELLEKQYDAQNVVLAPHGAFTDTPPPSFALPEGPQQIMTFGKFGTYKRVELLIEAFRLLSSNSERQIELVIAGTDSPNATGYLDEMKFRFSGVANIRYTGYVKEEDVPKIFGEAAVVVFPYTSTTGSSGVLHQAGEFGRAAVLPRLGDLAELIREEGYDGEFFDPLSAHSLADAIARVIDHSDRRIELGTRNYLAAKGLPISDVVDWYLIHFHQLQSKPTASQPTTTNNQTPATAEPRRYVR